MTTSQVEGTGNNLNPLQSWKGQTPREAAHDAGMCCSLGGKQLGAHRNEEYWGDTVKVISHLTHSNFPWVSKKGRKVREKSPAGL